MNNLRLLLLALLGAATVAGAAEAPPPADAEPDPAATPVPPADDTTEVQVPRPRSPDVFVPSEDISEDLAVSYPVDI